MKKNIWLLLLLLASPSWATVRYIATTGSDSNSCNQSESIANAKQHFMGVDGAFACMGSGDTLKVVAGTYSEAIWFDSTFRANASGTSSNPTIIEGNTLGFGTWTLQPTGGQCSTYDTAAILAGGSWFIVRGFIIDGQNQYSCKIGIRLADGSVPGTNFIFEDFEAKNLTADAIYSQSNVANHNTFRRCNIHDNGENGSGSGGGHAVYLNSPDNIIEHCEIYNQDFTAGAPQGGHGIHISQSTEVGDVSNNIIRYNYIHNNGATGIGYYGNPGSNGQIYGNIVNSNGTGTASTGIRIDWGANDAKVYNNTIYNNTAYCIEITANGVNNAIVRNNLCLSNSNNIIYNAGTGTIDENNIKSTDTTLVIDVATNKFSPSASGVSTLVDQGTSTGLPSGFSYVGKAPDIGAFEAPVRVSAIVTDAAPTIYSVTMAVAGQGNYNNTALLGCITTDWTIMVAGNSAQKDSCSFTQPDRINIALHSAVTYGQSLTDAYAIGNLTDHVCIGGYDEGACKNAQVLSWAAQNGTNETTQKGKGLTDGNGIFSGKIVIGGKSTIY